SAPHAKWIGYLFTGTNHPNRPMVDSRAWLTPKSAKAFSAGIRKSALGEQDTQATSSAPGAPA
ncbi:MAG: hypothetical protein ABIF71_05765, partial [Planctomycetota bacterium]